MRRRPLVVPVLFALSGLGWAVAHAVAHRAVMADKPMPASTAQHYLEYLTTSFALCLALALPLAAGTLVGRRWKGASLRSLWLFGLVPVVGFVGHTAAEPLVEGAGFATSLEAVGPIALVGLLLQIPFALAAVTLGRRLLWLAQGLARALAAPGPASVRPAAPALPRPHAGVVPAFLLDFSRTERGPPLLAA